MQISRHSVFVFVEGKKVDPYFYGKIAGSVCQPKGISYSLCKASEISGDGGGKQVLLSLFQYLRKKSALIDNFKGKKMAVIFYLDKDVDDILRTTRRSSHLVYTTYYDVYNHIFVEGKLAEAICAAASLDSQSLQSKLGDCRAFRYNLALQWKDWVKLCLFTAKKKVNCRANYRVTSQVNNSANGSLNHTSYAQVINTLKSRLGLTVQQFNRAFHRVSRLVDKMYSDDQHDYVFKGKWYCFLFTSYVRKRYSTADCHGLDSRLPSNMALTLDFNQPWADHFKQPLKQIIQTL